MKGDFHRLATRLRVGDGDYFFEEGDCAAGAALQERGEGLAGLIARGAAGAAGGVAGGVAVVRLEMLSFDEQCVGGGGLVWGAQQDGDAGIEFKTHGLI